MMKKLIIIFITLIPLSIFAQKSANFQVELSSDTVGLDGYIQVSFTINNMEVEDFSPPDFEGFRVQGPSSSTSVSIINGKKSQSTTYTYVIAPSKIGTFKLKSAAIKTDEGKFETDEKTIEVLEQYEIVEKPKKRNRGFFDDDDFFQNRPKNMPKEDVKKKKFPTEKL
jgi:BatD DUF11 like domain